MLRIYYVDDDPEDHFLVKSAAKACSLNMLIDSFLYAEVFLEFLKIAQPPSLILLDINGIEPIRFNCLRTIRADAKFKDIPVAIYSTSDYERDREEAEQFGANAYLIKPSSFDEIKKVMEEIFKLASYRTLVNDGFMNGQQHAS